MTDQDDAGNSAGLAVIFGFLIIIWVLRALFSAADQTK